MALPGNAFVTLREVQDYCRLEESDLPAIERYVASATDWIEDHCRLRVIHQTYTAELHSGDGSMYLYPRWWPISQVDKIEFLDGVSSWLDQDLTNVVIHPPRGFLVARDLIMPRGVLNVRVGYKAGYSAATTPVPEDLKQACLELVLDKWKQSDRQTQGITTLSFAGQSTSYHLPGIPKMVYEVANFYRRQTA